MTARTQSALIRAFFLVSDYAPEILTGLVLGMVAGVMIARGLL